MSEETPRESIRQEHESEELCQRTKDRDNRLNNIDDNQNQYRTERKTRFPRACTARSSLRYGYVEDEPSIGKKRKRGVAAARRDKLVKEKQCDANDDADEAESIVSGGTSTRVITTLVQQPESPAQLPRWSIRSMWEFASLLDFLHVFRPLLNITTEFSAEELETAFITPNSTLDDIHIPMLKSIPPVTRMALGRATWVTVLCRKLRDWWHWVADGELPIVASHGTEIETYKVLEPATRVLIMKALCDIRVEQEDIRSYIDNSVKHGMKLSAFRRERIGGDSHGVSYCESLLRVKKDLKILILLNNIENLDPCNHICAETHPLPLLGSVTSHEFHASFMRWSVKGWWGTKGLLFQMFSKYEDDPIIGHRLYRETRKIQTKKLKGKGLPTIPLISCQWETVATNLDEFEQVSDKLFSSTNRTEVSLGKKLKIDILPEVEEIHKKKERSLKKQHRQALLLDSFFTADGLTSGRSMRDRKPVTYTFDDFDRSINEAIKITKRRPSSPEQHAGRKEVSKPETSGNGNKSNGPSHIPQHFFYDNQSPKFSEYEESDGEDKNGILDRSDRRRKRPQRYSEKDYVEAISENDADFDSDDEIVGEVVYDEEYLRQRKQRKISSSSEGDEEYSWEGENAEEEEEEAEDSLSISEDSDDSRHLKKFPTRSRRGTKKLRSVDDHQASPRRSRRSTRPRINYRQYEISESEADSTKLEKSNASDMRSDPSSDPELSIPSHDSRDEDGIEMKDFNSNPNPNPNSNLPQNPDIDVEEPPNKQLMEQNNSNPIQEGSQQRRFLDLNELAGFDDGPSPPPIQGDGGNNF